MVYGDSAFSHHLFQVAQAQPIGKRSFAGFVALAEAGGMLRTFQE
jgi:hypothetical protein